MQVLQENYKQSTACAPIKKKRQQTGTHPKALTLELSLNRPNFQGNVTVVCVLAFRILIFLSKEEIHSFSDVLGK